MNCRLVHVFTCANLRNYSTLNIIADMQHLTTNNSQLENQHSSNQNNSTNSTNFSKHPTWATKFRTPGTELRFINGKYYLYQYTSVYDPIKKRSKKLSGNLLGRISQEEGFIQSSKNLLRKQSQQPTEQGEQSQPKQEEIKVGASKEFGFSQYILDHFQTFAQQLQKFFGDTWQHILLIVYCRLLSQAPIKNMPHLMEQSWLAHHWQSPILNSKKISELLKEIGKNREKAVEYMKSFIGKEGYFLADMTHIPSKSTKIGLSKKGYNSKGEYDPQVHILYLYGSSSQMPAFYRLCAGNIREVKAFKLTIQESGIKDGIIIGDKGFYSQANIEMLDKEKLSYIIPLKRNSMLLDYNHITTNSFKDGENYFKHDKRHVWHKEKEVEKGKKVVIFLDETLRLMEEEDYLTRMQTHPEEYTKEGYLEKKDSFGTISLITNLTEKKAEELYKGYKSRMAIETMFDSMKNVLEADKTYMQHEDTLQGWMFINHVALQCYQQLYLELQAHELSNKYSVKDFLMLLKDIRKVKINGEWHQAEIPTALEKLLLKLQKTHT